MSLFALPFYQRVRRGRTVGGEDRLEPFRARGEDARGVLHHVCGEESLGGLQQACIQDGMIYAWSDANSASGFDLENMKFLPPHL